MAKVNGGTTTVTDARLKKSARQYYGIENSDGKAFNTSSLVVEPVFIKKIYPELHLAEVVLRDNEKAAPFDVQILVPVTELIDNMPGPTGIILNNCKILTEPKTLHKYILLPNDVVGSVLAIQGDYTGNGGVLLGMVYMHGDGPLPLNINDSPVISGVIAEGSVTIANVTANTDGTVIVTVPSGLDFNKIQCYTLGDIIGYAQVDTLNNTALTIRYRYVNTAINRRIIWKAFS